MSRGSYFDREQELEEQRYRNSLGPFLRLVDGHWSYIGLMLCVFLVAFGIGLGIGLLL